MNSEKIKMDYETFKETLETFMNAETLIYSVVTAGAALIAGAVGYLRGKSHSGYKIRMAEIDRDKTLTLVEQRKAEIELEKIQTQTAPELERVKGENLRTGSQVRLEQMARESELEINRQRAEYEIEQKRREYEDGKIGERRIRTAIVAEKLGQRLEQYVQALRKYEQADGQTDIPVDDRYQNEREEFRRELADKFMENLEENHDITEEEFCADTPDVERIDGLAGLKYPYPRTQGVQGKPPVEPSRELKILLRLVGKKLD